MNKSITHNLAQGSVPHHMVKEMGLINCLNSNINSCYFSFVMQRQYFKTDVLKGQERYSKAMTVLCKLSPVTGNGITHCILIV